jgi:site-specific recombinase XerC
VTCNSKRCSPPAATRPHPHDFALVCLLGLLGLRIAEATGPNVSDLGEEHGHRVVRVIGKGHKIVLVPMPRPWRARSAPSTDGWPARYC